MAVSPPSQKAERLLATLRRLFQYDRGDLDFGIYRVLNQRRDEIERFLTQELLPEIQSAFAAQANGDESTSTLADGVCSDLERFFSRYYDEGDFLPLRRYRADTYAVPYEGEEVLLHWANRDQYYVKSSASLSGLALNLHDGRRLRLEVVASDEPLGGVKPAPGEERRFVLASDPVRTSGDELLVRFAYARSEKGISQADLNALSLEAIVADEGTVDWRVALGGDQGPLAEAIARFTAKNSQDYFIHRDLGRFLRRELDFFIKNEQLHVDEIDDAPAEHVERALARVRVFRRVAGHVIDFLHQVEEFQKRVWLKRKCVLDTSWLVTLDRVPEAFHAEIAANDAQRDAWVDLLAIDRIEATTDGSGYSKPLEPGFLLRFPHLVLDTRHFPEEFTDRLLEAIGDIDAATTGVLVHGENFQALSLLERRYRGEVSCIYIDPPYNTGGDGFLYKDAYQHSSWLSMMSDRLAAGRDLMDDQGVLFVSIDDDEHPRLRLALDHVFGPDNFVANIVWQKKYAPANDAKWFSDDHDHLIVTARHKEAWRPTKLPRTDETNAAYKNPDNDPRGPWRPDNYKSNKSRQERPNLFYGITNPTTGREIWPDETAVWRYTPEQHAKNESENRVWWGADGTNKVPAYKRFLSEVGGLVPRTIWTHKDAGHNQDGVRDLQGLFGLSPFASPKPVKLMRRILAVASGDLVADYFAGSGTFGHAVLDEAREADAARRFLLVESGEHFERVLRPRIIKAIHAGSWAEGVPEERRGVSSMVQCLRIEAYEDALDGIELERTDAQEDLLKSSTEFRQDYLLRYLLDHEARRPLLDRRLFARPFDARTPATIDGERTTLPVDLVATFSWLLGLRVDGTAVRDGVRVVRGLDGEGQRILVLWRTVKETPNDRLDAWFTALDEAVRGPLPDIVYVNGDATLGMARPDGQTWEVRLLEAEFERLMFLVADDHRAR
jgi:adenine-specific DNA-methyltransferase